MHDRHANEIILKYESENKALHKKIEKLQAKIEKRKDDFDSVHNDINQIVSNEQNLKKKYDEKVQNFKIQIDSFKSQLNSYISKNDQLLSIIEQKEYNFQSEKDIFLKKIKTLETEKSKNVDEKIQFEEKNKFLSDFISKIELKTQTLKEEISQCKNSNETLFKEKEQIASHAKIIEKELESGKSSLNLKINTLENTLQKLRSENNDLLRLIQENNQKNFRPSEVKIDQLTSDYQNFQKRTVEAEMATIISQLESARLKLKLNEDDLIETRERYDRLFDEKTKLYINYEQMQITINNLNEQIEEQKTKNQLKSMENQEFVMSIERLRTENKRLVTLNFDFEHLTINLKNECQTLRENNAELISNLKDEFNNTKQVSEKLINMGEYKYQIELLKNNAMEKEQEMTKINSKYENQRKKDKTNFEKITIELKSKIAVLENENEKNRQTIEHQKMEIEDLLKKSEKNAKIIEKNIFEEAEKKINNVKTENQVLEKKFDTLSENLFKITNQLQIKFPEINNSLNSEKRSSLNLISIFEHLIFGIQNLIEHKNEALFQSENTTNALMQEKTKFLKSLEDKKNEVDCKNIKIKQLSCENQVFSEQIEQNQGEIRVLTQKVINLTEMNSLLSKTITENERVHKQQFDNIHVKLKNEANVSSVVEILNIEKSKLEKENQELKDKESKIRLNIETLEAELNEIYTSKGILSKDLKSAKSENIKIVDQVEQLKNENESLKIKHDQIIANLKNEKDILTQKLAKLNNKTEDFSSENDELKNELDVFKNLINKYQKDLSVVNNENVIINAELKGKILQNEQLIEQVKNLSTDKNSLQTNAVVFAEKLEDFRESNRIISEKQKLLLIDLQKTKTTEKLFMETLNRIFDLMNEKDNSLNPNMFLSETDIRIHDLSIDNLEELITKIRNIIQEMSDSKKNNLSLKKRAFDLEEENLKLNDQINKLQHQTDDLIQKSNSKFQNFETRIHQKNTEEFERHSKLQNQYSEMIAKYEQELADLADKNTLLLKGNNMLIQKINEEKRNCSQQISDLTHHFTVEIESLNGKNGEINAKVKTLEKRVLLLDSENKEKSGLIFQLQKNEQENLRTIKTLSESNQKIHEFKEQKHIYDVEMNLKNVKLTELGQKYQEIHAKYSECATENTKLKDDFGFLQKKLTDNMVLANEFNALKQKVVELVDENNALVLKIQEIGKIEQTSMIQAEEVINDLKTQMGLLIENQKRYEGEKLKLIQYNEQMSTQLNKLQLDLNAKMKIIDDFQIMEKRYHVDKTEKESMNQMLVYLMSQVEEPSYKKK